MTKENSDKKIHQSQKEGKPLMEKRRRARINESLSRLKLMVLGEVKRKNTKITKLDKADILEMTVEYVNRVTENGSTKPRFDKYRAGFNSCADEVRSYLACQKEIDVEVRTRVIDHLANFIQNIQWYKSSSNPPFYGGNGIPDITSRDGQKQFPGPNSQEEFPRLGNSQQTMMTSLQQNGFSNLRDSQQTVMTSLQPRYELANQNTESSRIPLKSLQQSVPINNGPHSTKHAEKSHFSNLPCPVPTSPFLTTRSPTLPPFCPSAFTQNSRGSQDGFLFPKFPSAFYSHGIPLDCRTRTVSWKNDAITSNESMWRPW